MKSHQLTALLVGILIVSSICTAGLATWHAVSVRTNDKKQRELTELSNVQARVQLLVSEVMEYRKRNPSIDPILQSVNLVPRVSQPVPPAPKITGK